ncbi:Exosome complex component RRP45 [Geranomyces michiganensis]|nr:Exosome complex component RRP45 [Geranomyces michiganensis]
MSKEVPPSLNEKAFLLSALQSRQRLDSRGPHDIRTTRILLGPQAGHAEVRLGKTRVTANVSCAIVRPRPGAPTEGSLKFTTDFSPMASPAFGDGPSTGGDEILIARVLERALKGSRAVDAEGLCIVAGEKVWQITVDVRVLDHEGNIVDCACIAAVAGLMHFKRPDVTVLGEDVTVHSISDRNPIPLTLHHIPICVTFAFFNSGTLQVVDPSLLEEQCAEGDMTFVVNRHGDVCTLSKAGGVAVEAGQVIHCARIAAAKAEEMTEMIKAALDKAMAKEPKAVIS